jgi:pyrroloquinoline quinone biosynthesis protein B
VPFVSLWEPLDANLRSLLSYTILFLLFAHLGCKDSAKEEKKEELPDKFLVVLGIMQDAGYPQAGCEKECCKAFWNAKEPKELITSLALVDRRTNQYWLLEASPDIVEQLQNVQQFIDPPADLIPDGILISHAHIGHYTGLMQFGREVMGAKDIPVWVMPRMDSFLRNNGPWSQLVALKNIQLQSLQADRTVSLNASLKITPVKVPHRDEFSETVGFIIQSNKKKVLFIPDIDKWEKWERSIVDLIKDVDIALLDGTFYQNGELPGRDMKEIPHPFVEESLQRFSALSSEDKKKIVFIHFNHTNPLLKMYSPEKEKVRKEGFGVAEEEMIIEL